MRIRNDLRYRNDEKYRDKQIKRTRRNYWADPDKSRARVNAMYKERPENWHASSANSSAKLKAAYGIITGQDILAVLSSQNYECRYCGCSLAEKYQVDHALAFSKGGPNVIENIQCLCHRCHANKTAQEVREAKAKKKRA